MSAHKMTDAGCICRDCAERVASEEGITRLQARGLIGARDAVADYRLGDITWDTLLQLVHVLAPRTAWKSENLWAAAWQGIL